MKDFNNIEDWYKDELDKFNVEPNDEVWESLSDDLDANMTLTDDNIGEWYKREVNKLEERPDYTVWEKLATKLDTVSVWERLVISLNRYEQYVWWRNLILKGSAVLLLLAATYSGYNNYFNDENSLANIQFSNVQNTKNEVQQSIKDVKLIDKISIRKEMKIQSSDQQETVTKNLSLVSSSVLNKNTKNHTKYQTFVLDKNSIDMPYFPSIQANINTEHSTYKNIANTKSQNLISVKDITYQLDASDFLVKKEKNKIIFNSKRFSSYFSYGIYAKRFYFGAYTGFKKQDLITSVKKNHPFNSLKRTDYLDFGSNFGLTVGYILSNKINLESNISIYSTAGYDRKYQNEETKFRENLQLNYSTISFIAKRMNAKSTFDNKVYSTNFFGGVYASYLNSASTNMNGVNIKNDNFIHQDFGIILGIEQDRYLSKSLIITPSVRYNQGLINIANQKSPFQSARNISFEFNLGIKYILLKKGK